MAGQDPTIHTERDTEWRGAITHAMSAAGGPMGPGYCFCLELLVAVCVEIFQLASSELRLWGRCTIFCFIPPPL